jgi:hypothetical protein
MIAGTVLAVVLLGGGFAWMRHNAALAEQAKIEAQQREQERQRIAEQQKQSIEHQVATATAPVPTSTAPVQTPAEQTVKPAADPGANATGTNPAATPGTKPAPPQTKPAGTTTTTPAATPPAPSTSPAVSATTGELQITTTPGAAQVNIDGAIQGTTPFNARNLLAGQHTVNVSKPGYRSATRTIEVAAGKSTPLVVALEAVPTANVTVTSQPSGGKIFIDQKDTNRVTPATLSLGAGEHHIAVHKEGYREASTTTPKLAAGQTFTFAPMLPAGNDDAVGGLKRLFGGIPEGKGMANLKTTPKGAQVFLNGYSAPKVTPFKMPLDPGKYELTFKLDGYKPQTKKVEIEKGKSVEVDVKLDKK